MPEPAPTSRRKRCGRNGRRSFCPVARTIQGCRPPPPRALLLTHWLRRQQRPAAPGCYAHRCCCRCCRRPDHHRSRRHLLLLPPAAINRREEGALRGELLVAWVQHIAAGLPLLQRFLRKHAAVGVWCDGQCGGTRKRLVPPYSYDFPPPLFSPPWSSSSSEWAFAASSFSSASETLRGDTAGFC